MQERAIAWSIRALPSLCSPIGFHPNPHSPLGRSRISRKCNFVAPVLVFHSIKVVLKNFFLYAAAKKTFLISTLIALQTSLTKNIRYINFHIKAHL